MKLFFKLFVIFLIFLSCLNFPLEFINGSENQMPSKPIEEVLDEHTPKLMSMEGVIGTAEGLCNNESCIIVFVIKKTDELIHKLPNTLEGYPVLIEETGVFKALPE